MNKSIVVGLIVCVLALSGCAGINSDQASVFNQTVAATNTSLGTTLTNAQTVDLDAQIAQLAKKGSIDTYPGDITSTNLPDKTKNAITSQFNFLVQYAGNLSKVTGNQTSFATSVGSLNAAADQASTDANALTKQLGDFQLLTGPQVTSAQNDLTSISKIVAAAGQGLINLYADHQAYEIATQTNRAIQDYCSLLQTALGSGSTLDTPIGLYGLVENSYSIRIRDLALLYSTASPLKAPEAQPADHIDEALQESQYLYITRFQERSALIKQIHDLEQQKTQDLNTILSLAKAVGQIAQAHQALVDQKKESFSQEITAAITTLQNLTKDYNTGAGTSATSTATPSTTSTTTSKSTATQNN